MYMACSTLRILSGPETGKRKRVPRKADGKPTLFGEFRGVVARKADVFGYPFQLIHFSLPISGPLKYIASASMTPVLREAMVCVLKRGVMLLQTTVTICPAELADLFRSHVTSTVVPATCS